MKGIYMEFDTYEIDKLTQEELKALKTLGISFHLDYGLRKLKIIKDTAILKHDKCELRE